MKNVVLSILTIITIFVAFGYINQSAHGNGGGAPAGRTGSPGDGGASQSCARSGCHTGGSNPVSGSVNASITSTIPATGYIPGQTYTVTGFVQGTSLVEFGFEISPQNTAGTQYGTLVVTDVNATQLVGSNKYITHKAAGTAGTGNRTWTFNWIAPTAGTGAFSFYGAFNATNSNNNVSGDIIYLEELPIVEAAQINTQPTNQSACSGANSSFSISATGTNITYQWKKNGIALTNDGHFSGVTTNTLSIANVGPADVDSYTCEVTGSGNTVTSNAATLTVTTPASISDDPAALTLCAGATATFNVTAAGTNITYQWKRNNVNVTNGGGISGATTNQLTITSVAAGNAGTYTCQVSNTCATPTSAGALLTVNAATAINTQPAATTTLCAGGNLTLTVAAVGTNLSYQWKRGVTNVGTNSPTLTINGVTTGDAGSYTCEVTGTCGNVTSNAAVVTVNTVTAINTQPSATTTLCQGGTLNLSVAAVGANLSYQWKRGTTNVGTNSPSLSIPNTTVNDAGTYTVTVTGACGSVISGNALVNITPTTAITTQPVTQSGCTGSNITFTVVASGGNLSYQWRKGITPVGTNSPTLTINNIAAGDAGNYTVEITGTCGSMVTSNAATLTVASSASISQQPTAQLICVGSPLTLTVVGNGGNNTTYQWRRNNNNVGTSSSTYNVPVTTANDLGTYDVVITGSCGTVTSDAVNVIAIDGTVINNVATNSEVCIGSALSLTVSADGQNLAYQWFYNAQPIDGETGVNLEIDTIALEDGGLYSILVTGDCGVVSADITQLTVVEPPTITSMTLPLPICAGNDIVYAVTVSGTAPNYKWQKNGVDIPNANQPAYTAPSPQDGDIFTFFAWNNCDTVSTSFEAAVNPLPVPVVSQINGLVIPGILITQSGFVSYQWLNNGVPLPDSNNDTISVDNNFSFYSVIATTSDGCSDTSAAYFFAVSSVTENALSGISIYPNPSSSDVYFTTPANMGNFNVKIISTTGQLVMDKMVENKQLNIAQLPSGLYTVLVTYQGKTARVMLAKE